MKSIPSKRAEMKNKAAIADNGEKIMKFDELGNPIQSTNVPVQKAAEHGCQTKPAPPAEILCADSDLTDQQRGPCYEGWTQYRDECERLNDSASLVDYRAGFIQGHNAALASARQEIERLTDERDAYKDVAEGYEICQREGIDVDAMAKDAMNGLINNLVALLQNCTRQRDRYKAGLAHYADESTWQHHSSGVDKQDKRQYVAICYDGEVTGNGYDHAREVLAGGEDETANHEKAD